MKPIDTTPDRVILTAQRLFAERGYAGTSVRDITSRAKANLGAVTYHFGSKEKLYQAVLLRLVAPMVDGVIAEASVPGPVLDRIGSLVAFYYRYLHEHPDLPRFMLQIMAEHGPLPKALAQLQSKLLAAVVTLVARGQREGDVRPGPIPLLSLSIMSQPIFFMLARRVVTQVVGLNTDDPAVIEAAMRHSSAIVRQGLAADPKGGIPA